ncbi:TonB-dependent receptor plug domain-containing protein [Carnimonas nigrificans]|uniref:TonB-dependent receptor plug domain-containing protein n=1 Tax=Carnimonas nigrificans TaxID=64323 RepID=UPI00046E7A1E|nr:TonB-dependent receptor [Carnimonas nigrificans]
MLFLSFRALSRPRLAAALMVAYPLAAVAQSPAPDNASASQEGDTTPRQQQATRLPEIQVTANPFASSRLSSPSSVVTGDELNYRQQASLGETLNGLPGVSSSYFGPFASRPIIRGMDGDRIRILRNGTESFDASSLSQDHAVPEDPMGLDRVEVLRGPSALLYGGNAIGGVVNTIDGRIPREALEGISGKVESGFSTANNDRHAGAALNAGHDGFNLHVDGSSRSFQRLRIPGHAATKRFRQENPDDDHSDESGRLTNSDGRADSATIGSSYAWDHGYAGFSYNRYRSNYGSVAEPDARLDMQQDNYHFDSEVRDLEGPFTSVKAQASYTRYKHSEIEDGEVGTTFKNRGVDARIEAHHAALGPLDGVVGTEFSHSRFSALGEEGFIPQTDTDKYALFALEKWQVTPRLDLNFGARLDYTRLSPEVQGAEQFAKSRDRNFVTPSLSVGSVFKLDDIWSLTGNLSYTERAPTFYELYANGPHGATGTYEVGNPDASREKAISADAALEFDTGKHTGRIGVFYTHFSNYLGMRGTGEEQPGEDGPLPVYEYADTKARFFGVEAQSKWQLYDGPSGLYHFEAGGDYTNAEDTERHQPLPRIAPLRLRSALDWQLNEWDAQVSVERAAGQHRVPHNSGDDSLSTGGYTRLDTRLGYHFDVGATQWFAFLKGGNLTDAKIRYASSVLREYSPAARRNLQLGVQMNF